MFKLILVLSVFVFGRAQAQNLKLYVTLSPAGDFVSESDKVTGNAIENPDGSVEAKDIRVPVKSLKSGISLRDEHMADKYLEASKYPDIILKVAKGRDGKGVGILVVKGKEAKVSGTYGKSKDRLKASFSANISDFGIGDINYRGVGVDNEVKIEVLVPLVKAQSMPASKTKSTTTTAVPVKSVARPTTKPTAKPVAPKK